MVRIGPYLKLSRPFTLLAPAVGGLLFALLAVRLEGVQLTWGLVFRILPMAFILAVANYVGNVLNQVFDRDIDYANPSKRKRPIPSGAVSPENAMSLAWVLTLIIITVSWLLYGFLTSILLTVILLFAWLYSSPPARFRSRLYWGNLAIGTPRGMLGVLAAYSSVSGTVHVYVLLVGFIFAVYVFLANTAKDIDDCEYDMLYGVRNFVTVYGKEAGVSITLAGMAIAHISLYIASAIAGYSVLMWTFIPMPVVFYTLYVSRSPFNVSGEKLWRLFYIHYTLLIMTTTLPVILNL